VKGIHTLELELVDQNNKCWMKLQDRAAALQRPYLCRVYQGVVFFLSCFFAGAVVVAAPGAGDVLVFGDVVSL